MKDERPIRLTLARESILQLSAEKLREIKGGSGIATSVIGPCPGVKPASYYPC